MHPIDSAAYAVLRGGRRRRSSSRSGDPAGCAVLFVVVLFLGGVIWLVQEIWHFITRPLSDSAAVTMSEVVVSVASVALVWIFVVHTGIIDA